MMQPVVIHSGIDITSISRLHDAALRVYLNATSDTSGRDVAGPESAMPLTTATLAMSIVK